MRTVEHNMICITFEFADYDFAQSWFINYDLRICRLWLALNTTWFLSLPKKSDVLYYVRGICHGTWCTVVGPQIAKPKNCAQGKFESRTSRLGTQSPTRYPNNPFPHIQNLDYDWYSTQASCGTQSMRWNTLLVKLLWFPGNSVCPNSHVTFCSLPVSTRIKVYYVNLYQQKSNKLGVLGTKTGWPILAMYGICRQRPTT